MRAYLPQEYNRKQGWEQSKLAVSFENLTVTANADVEDILPTVASEITGCFKPNRKDERPLLSGITGVGLPGEMVLIMGPPGAGCTTLLKTLAGMSSKELKIEGSLMYNGSTDLSEFQSKVRFVNADDCHFPAYTVHKTLTLAAQLNMPMNMPMRTERLASLVTSVMHVLGIYHVRNSLVGDDILRGVSGGEKKRVTIAEMLLAHGSGLFLDNFTKGLDAAATVSDNNGVRLMTVRKAVDG